MTTDDLATSSPRPPRAPHRALGVLGLMALALLAPGAALARDASPVQVIVDPQIVEIGEGFTYTLTASAPSGKSLQIRKQPDLSAFAIMGHSLSQNRGGGRSLSLTYTLRPRKTGKFTIPAPVVRVGDRDYKGAAAIITVVARGKAPSTRRKKKDDAAFIHVTVRPNTRRPFVGEQITVAYELYMDTHRLNGQPRLPSEPSLDDFWIEHLNEDSAGVKQLVRYRGRFYEKILIRNYALFPLRAGPTTIDPMKTTLAVSTFMSSPREVELASDPIKLDVRPLPPGAPQGFHEGNVGQWQVALKRHDESATARVGEPLRLTVTVTGTGQLGRLRLPAFDAEALKGFRLIKGDADTRPRVKDSVVGGTRQQLYTLIPTRAGEQTIPALELVYFDPQTERYVTQRTEPITLKVESGELPAAIKAAASPPQRRERSEGDLMASLRASLQPPGASATLTAARPAWSPARSPLYWLALAAPLLALAYLTGRPLAARLSDPERSRKKRALGSALDRLNAAETPSPLAPIHDAIHLYMIEALEIPSGAITSAELPRRLTRMGADAGAAEALGEALKACSRARFSRDETIDGDTVEALKTSTRAALITIDGARKRHKLKLGSLAPWLLAGLTAAATLTPAPAHAAWSEAQQAQHQQALKAFQAQRWDEAARTWHELLEASPAHPELLTALGTTHAHRQDLGRARLYLERALLHEPGDHVARANLEAVERMVRVQTLESISARARKVGDSDAFFWWHIARRVPASVLALTLLISAWLALLALLMRRRLRHDEALRDMAGVVVVLALAVATLAAGAWWARASVMRATRPAVLLSKQAELREGPSAHAAARTPDIPLLPGLMVPVQTTQQGWSQIVLPDQSVGWLPADALGEVNAAALAPPLAPSAAPESGAAQRAR